MRSGPSRAGRRRPPPRDWRRTAARLAAPVAFLAAVTIAVLLVRAGLTGAAGDVPPPTTTATATAATTTFPTASEPVETVAGTTTVGAAPAFYTIESGDTLEQIAVDHDTTVEALLELNPELDPVALTVGQKIRVG